MNTASSTRIDLRLSVHHLQFTLEAQTFVQFGRQAGAQLRGALWAALEQFACTDPRVRTAEHRRHCPMCRLVALETGESARGANPPRPFVIRPPRGADAGDECSFHPGERFTIGVSLFGNATELFPYICQAIYRAGSIGVGFGRGQFTIHEIHAVNPISGQTQPLFEGGRVQAAPTLPLTHDQVLDFTAVLPSDHLNIHFLTATQLTSEGRVSTKPQFDILIARLLERCQAMEIHYTEEEVDAARWRSLYLDLTAQAADVKLVKDDTRWLKVLNGSRRSNSVNSISGLVGQVRYEGDLTPFLYWLVWGSVLHVGKNAVKGNGWYEIR